ncbi:hypothetical protein [Chromobacterium violaceum]|uniref:hypothetical protein n=1 Tax=Chromobacterium violaceum TaxID=536 RepID=UPI0015F7C200|nr:hypothetical protein [Chromobacterium violaceum]MBA8735813.1 hypothetical protein [Chromobacterium violaceum]
MTSKQRRPDKHSIREQVFPFEMAFPATMDQQRLLLSYPLFFRAARHPLTYLSNLGYWGIQCGPGWHQIVEKAASEIETELQGLLERLNNTFELASVDRRLQRLPAVPKRGDEGHEDGETVLIPFCSEIKVAEGELHIGVCSGYLCDWPTWQRIRAAVMKAQLEAKTRCERCGKPGLLRVGYWERVYCAGCAG